MERISSDESLEIEAKFRVVSHEGIRRRLRELHIPQVGFETQRDVYYASPLRDFGRTDEALRIRYTTDRIVLTYKGPKLATHGLKARQEVNVELESGENMEKILQNLGFSPAYTVKKSRERYEWKGVEIALDTVQDLGTFVEIELKSRSGKPEESIEEIKKELGIEGTSTPLSYLELLLKET
jgi:adenylate cyclase class 2